MERRRVASPLNCLVTPHMSTSPVGYSGTPLAKKLGIGVNARVCEINAPGNYIQLLEPLPSGVSFQAKPTKSTDVVHVFVRQKSALSMKYGRD
jgi:hypothetical protein